jgi:hypothetical protein
MHLLLHRIINKVGVEENYKVRQAYGIIYVHVVKNHSNF